ncbi:hypothetical protein [Thalassococcus sp. S3]|uniref:hypothetical protein n=1 Tax=Thalassococcus sp. S3 TaxID=2017482 RepID=UPI00102ABA78|nr:hypothetical protein [Thalassococcus sp. S3]
MRYALPIALVMLVFGLAHAFGLTGLLGAHPFWAGQVLWVGAPLGVVLAFALWITPLSALVRTISLGVLTLCAMALAHLGKTRFVASYAEDVLAGQIWYLGWIATCVFAAACVASSTLKTRRSL